MKKMLMGALALGFGLAVVPAQAQDAVDTSQIFVKKAIADKMTASQLAIYKGMLAQRKAAGRFDHAKGPGVSLTPGDTCTAATYEIGALPFIGSDTTTGATDNFDLPADTTNPTCAAATTCTGAGPAGSLPRGAIYTGTGTGPDRGYRIRVSADCPLVITMDPTDAADDLGLIVYQAQCSSALADCVCVDDTGVGGVAESVTLNALASVNDYFIVTDGYSTGATPPGPDGPYSLNITTTGGCTLVPVELQGFSVE
jgi:hypothetical protein